MSIMPLATILVGALIILAVGVLVFLFLVIFGSKRGPTPPARP